MNNNKLGAVAIKTASRKRARFNLAHDVNTTFSFGDIQPAMCRMVTANSKTSVSMESLVRLAPLLSPTFGRIKYKQFHHFVGMSDLTQNYSALMAQQEVTRSQGTFTPASVPYCKLSYLSRLVLSGAKCTIYDGSSGGNDTTSQIAVNLYNITDINSLPSGASSLITSMGTHYSTSTNIAALDNYQGPTLDLAFVFADSTNLKLPIANQTSWSFFDVDPSALNTAALQHFSGDVTTVPLESADYVVTRPFSSGSGNITFAFRLSSLVSVCGRFLLVVVIRLIFVPFVT